MLQYDLKFDNEIRQILQQHNFTAGMMLKSKKNRHLFDYIMSNTDFLNDDVNLTTRAFFTVNHRQDRLKCKHCGKELENQNLKYKEGECFEDHFRRFCSVKCEMQDEDTFKTLKMTNIKKYGCEWTFQSDNNQKKSLHTMNERYGCDYAQQNKRIKEKQLQTMNERYGCNAISQTEDGQLKSLKSKRTTMYYKLTQNEFVKPLFSKEEYLKYGEIKEYKWRCLQCGHEFMSFKNDSWFKQGQVRSYARCDHCFPYECGTSSGEQALLNFLKENLRIGEYLKYRCKSIIKPYELDICIVSNGKPTIAFEYDGIWWHSDGHGTPKDYHLKKIQMCEDNGIQLIHVFENEWTEKQEIVKSRIKNLLGIYDKTVFARKCEVREVGSQESRDFQEENHIQGSVKSKVNLGLFHENELISLMTFSKPRFDKKHEWELVRFCNKLGYHIPGAAGKLLKYFENTYSPKNLVSYADRRWSQGNLYEKLGFKLDHISKPDYWYVKNKKLYSRVRFQKHKLNKILDNFNPNVSEKQNMLENGFNCIYDCGNLVFIKNY